jgi:CelD/BcsL family acetyltransferase involved in cellulose biosynthesis
MTHIEICTPDAIATEWAALCEASDDNEPMRHPMWLLPWWRTFGDGRRPHVLAARRSGRLVGVAPLVARRVWAYRRLEWLGSGEDEADEICSEYLGPVFADDDARRAVATELAASRGWDELQMPAMDGAAPSTAAWSRALIDAGLRVEATPAGEAPRLALRKDWLASLGSDGRYLVKRSRRDFDAWAAGTARIDICNSVASFPAAKHALSTLHGERWADAGHTGVFTSARFAAFHDQAMADLLGRGALRLLTLSAHGRAVAALYNFVWNGRVYFYQSGRAVDLPQSLRPGIVAHAAAIDAAHAEGLTAYDFLGGASQYKRKLSTELRPLVALRVSRAPARDAISELARRAVRAVRSRLQS